MRALIIGVDSNIGAALAQKLRQRNVTVIGTHRRQYRGSDHGLLLDLAGETTSLSNLPECDVAFFCAAMTNFAECRADLDLALQVNVRAPASLARHLTERFARVVFLSTAAVFDCREPLMRADRPRHPTSIYGQLKSLAEDDLMQLGEGISVLRLTKVITPSTGFLRQWIISIRARRAITAFTDHRIAPIDMTAATDALCSIGERGAGGVYQISGERDISYADLARHLTQRLGGDENCVRTLPAIDGGLEPGDVLPFTSLDVSRLADLTGFKAPNPYAVLDNLLDKPL